MVKKAVGKVVVGVSQSKTKYFVGTLAIVLVVTGIVLGLYFGGVFSKDPDSGDKNPSPSPPTNGATNVPTNGPTNGPTNVPTNGPTNVPTNGPTTKPDDNQGAGGGGQQTGLTPVGRTLIIVLVGVIFLVLISVILGRYAFRNPLYITSSKYRKVSRTIRKPFSQNFRKKMAKYARKLDEKVAGGSKFGPNDALRLGKIKQFASESGSLNIDNLFTRSGGINAVESYMKNNYRSFNISFDYAMNKGAKLATERNEGGEYK